VGHHWQTPTLMLAVTNKLFYTGSVNGPPRGDASSIGGGFRSPTLYTGMASAAVTQANGAWQAVRPTLTPAAGAPEAPAAAGTPASATDVALALSVLGAAQPPPVLP